MGVRELLDLAEERANALAKSRGYIYQSEIYDIWQEILRENEKRFIDELRKGNVTFVDFGSYE